MHGQAAWQRVHFTAYAVAWGISYSYALRLMNSGAQTGLAVCGLMLLAVSVCFFFRHIRQSRYIIGVLFAALVLASWLSGEYILAVLHVGAFVPLMGWMGEKA